MSNLRYQLGSLGGGGGGGNPTTGRSTSVNSTSSIGGGRVGRSMAGNAALQNSEAKSMVRVALKN